jgi:hypothetical protein
MPYDRAGGGVLGGGVVPGVEFGVVVFGVADGFGLVVDGVLPFGDEVFGVPAGDVEGLVVLGMDAGVVVVPGVVVPGVITPGVVLGVGTVSGGVMPGFAGVVPGVWL